ncbi:MAG: MmcQ/YjbR family DNA-binding protein [Planctomycetes bacterium]|nr:MmcQ/YjbR family DNA-binding protein [Planctomycetota bacterium]
MPSLAESSKLLALSLADVEESVACAGTALEQSSYGVRKKSFLFVHEREGSVTLRLKLEAENASALELARAEPESYQVGKQGWVTVRLPAESRLSAVVKSWIRASHALASAAPPKARATSAGAKVAAKRSRKTR